MRKVVLVLLCSIFFLPMGFTADQEELEILLFQEVPGFSAATRTSADIHNTPGGFYLVTKEDIHKNGYVTLVDVMKDVPGVRVSQPGNGEDGELFLMRGLLGNNYAKILVNGLPHKPNVVSGTPIDEQIPLHNLERIEVVFGPAAALYGADALAGVINLVTVQPQSTDDTYSRVSVSGGSDDYGSANFFTSFFLDNDAENQLGVTVYGQYMKRGDQDIFEDYGFIYGEGFEGADDIEKETKSIGVQLNWGDFLVSYDYQYRRDNSSLGQTNSFYKYDDAFWGESLEHVFIKHQKALGNLTFMTNVAYRKYALDNETTFSFTFDLEVFKYQSGEDFLFEEVVSWTVSDQLNVVSGITYETSDVLPKTNDLAEPFDEDAPPPNDPNFGLFGINPIKYDQIGAFTQIHYKGEKLNVLAGLRYDVNSRFDNVFSPRAAMKYNMSDRTNFSLAYNEAYRAPSPFEEFDSVAFMVGPGAKFFSVVPNEELEPENYYNIEAGLGHSFSETVSLEISVWYQEIEDLISITDAPLDKSIYDGVNDITNQVDNGGTANLLGADFILRFKDLISSIKLNMEASVSFYDGEEEYSDGSVADRFREVPDVFGKIRFWANPFERWYFAVDQTFSDDFLARKASSYSDSVDPTLISDSYYIMDLLIRFSPTDNIDIYLRVDNVFDEVYAGIGGYTFSGATNQNSQFHRQVRVGASLTF